MRFHTVEILPRFGPPVLVVTPYPSWMFLSYMDNMVTIWGPSDHEDLGDSDELV